MNKKYSESVSSWCLVLGLLLAGTGQSFAGFIDSLTKIGDPLWELADFNLWSGPLEANGFADIDPHFATIFPPPNHTVNFGVFPGTPHAGPYDNELTDGLTNAGITAKDNFAVSEFANGQGVYWGWMAVPRAVNPAMGSSPDFASGPIIPGPITLLWDFELLRNGLPFDATNFPVDIPLGVGLDGHSHVPLFLIEGLFFNPSEEPRGHYQHSGTLLDAQGNGWQLSSSFSVPIPSVLALWAIGVPALILIRRRRKQTV